MGKHKTPDVQISFIHQAGKGQAFFRLYRDLFYSPKFQKLSNSAKTLYLAMGLASNGQKEFTFPFSAYSKLMTKDTFQRSKRQLILAGFIKEERYKTIANRYFLCDEWKK